MMRGPNLLGLRVACSSASLVFVTLSSFFWKALNRQIRIQILSLYQTRPQLFAGCLLLCDPKIRQDAITSFSGRATCNTVLFFRFEAR